MIVADHAIPHPKHDGDDRYSGVGIYKFNLQNEFDPAEVFSMADQVVEEGKLRAVC